MAFQDTRIQPRLLKLLGCIEERFSQNEIELGYLGPQPGALTDLTPMGENCSMAWVRVATVTPIVGTAVRCHVRLAVQIEVGFATCYHIDEDGSPHTADEDIALMVEVTNAQALLLEAILCCDWHTPMKDVDVLSWSPAGPDGGAVGGAWLVSVEIT